MEFQTDKILVAFNNDRPGDWLKSIQGQHTLQIREPVHVFVQWEFVDPKDVIKANLLNLSREIVTHLVLERVIKNSQQVYGIMVDKRVSSKRGFYISICKI